VHKKFFWGGSGLQTSLVLPNFSSTNTVAMQIKD
jgi:hypothetical protein